MNTLLKMLVAGVLAGLGTFESGAAADPPMGLLLTLKSGGREAVSVTPGVQLQAAAGKPVSPLLPTGPFTAEWSGHIKADLRGDFRFKAAARGRLQLEINGKKVLEGGPDAEGFIGPSDEIRLNKGANSVRATFTPPADGAAHVRLLWSEYGFLWEPVPAEMLSHESESASLTRDETILRGRELFLNRRCVRCHSIDTAGVPELAMDAPDFTGIGSRRQLDWLARWIKDPRAERPEARMPRLLHSPSAAKDATDIAAYLSTLTDDTQGLSIQTEEDGSELINRLHCRGCHQLPGEEPVPDKISLAHVSAKFREGRLAAFLMQPARHYRWQRMPDFKLLPAEAAAIAKTLQGQGGSADTKASGDVVRGRELVATTGCLNCHALPSVENRAKPKALRMIGDAGGCLDGADGLPDFGFGKDERKALSAFLATDRGALHRHVPAEFALRQARELNCRSCHGALEGFPPFDRLGGKLKPEYMTALIAGEVKDKPRPWLAHVMPRFPVIAKELAAGLANAHGFPAVTPDEAPVDQELVDIGRRLVGVEGGFSCISCHGVGDLQPTQVFEAEGINLALPARRLQKDYYFRWLLNPMKIEPQTKMPVYFDEEGNSPLFDVLDGKATRQLEAFWQYMRAGDAIKPPALPGF